MEQPGWMSKPRSVNNSPPGLEYLSAIDHILVHQQLELLEIFTGFETNNKYLVQNTAGENVYFAIEDNDAWTRNICTHNRPFEMQVLDSGGNEVIHFHRPFGCDSCCCPRWLQRLEVAAPPGTVIGSVEQQWSICKPRFHVKNAAGDVLFKMMGPLITCSCFGQCNVEFNVFSADDDTVVGKITKHGTGLREIITDASTFGINFPMAIDVKTKAILLGGCFLIDYMFYEDSG